MVEFPVGNGPSNPHMSLEHNGKVFVPDLVGVCRSLISLFHSTEIYDRVQTRFGDLGMMERVTTRFKGR